LEVRKTRTEAEERGGGRGGGGGGGGQDAEDYIENRT